MPLTRNQIQISTQVLEAMPFNWPRSKWEVLEVRLTETTGWKDLNDSAVVALNAMYNAAQGRVDDGMDGIIVQYIEGTGGPDVTVTDWRGNTGTFCFAPENGFEIEEIHGAAGDGISRFTGVIRLVKVV